MSDSERQKKKNLLLSYYTNSSHNIDIPNSNSNRNTLSSASITTTNTTDNASFTSNETNSKINNQNEIHTESNNPYDINSTFFDPDMFLKKLIKDKTLVEIMDIENEIVKETRKLDSEMQTLVSENYNKFISATDTIRKMRNDFKKMEDEMEHLVTNMSQITEFNDKINNSFKDRRKELTRLSSIDNLLKKLQFLFELPAKLNEFITIKNSFALAVKYYCKARKTLDHYKQMPTFKNIEDDCKLIINNLKLKLYENMESLDSSSEKISESVNLLYQLDEPMENLCDKYFNRVEKSLDSDLDHLQLDIDLISSSLNNNHNQYMDILEFVDHGCNNFLASLSSIIISFKSIFNQESNEETNLKLNKLVEKYWLKYCSIVRKRFEVEQNLGENTIIVRAVDRFYRRIQTINKQIPNIDLTSEASNIALYAAMIRVNFYLQVLKQHFNECLIDLRHNVALIGTNNLQQSTSTDIIIKSTSNEKKLQQLHDLTFKSIIEQIKNVLTNLQAFIGSDISFSAKVHFNEPFCKDYVRESLLIPYLKYIAEFTREYSFSSNSPALLLILTKLCLEFDNCIDYLLTLVDEQFFIDNKRDITHRREISDLFNESSKLLINYYVKIRGLHISQMIRKSVETRDWLNTIEPRNVRAVMKRIVEDLTSIDFQVGELFEVGQRKERGSDSSRNTYNTRQTQRSVAWSLAMPSNAENKLMNNIQKLFAEKIEIFSHVEFTKVSVLTGIVKITLKTLLECIRLKTFSKYGLQQIQVDCHYLQLFLWRFVSDENLVYSLIEEIITSAIHRCVDPQLMESRVVELICETA